MFDWWSGWCTALCIAGWLMAACVAWSLCAIASHADEMPCGHSKDSIRGNGTTWYCSECEHGQ